MSYCVFMLNYKVIFQAIIDILAYRDNLQRANIATHFKAMFGKDLSKELKSELSGNFRKVCRGLLKTSVEYDIMELRNAMKVSLCISLHCW